MLEKLEGLTIKSVSGLVKYSDEIVIITECGKKFTMYHDQDYCETVELEDFEGDTSDLIGGYVVSAKETSGDIHTLLGGLPEVAYEESYTWTFYNIDTNKGSVWLRWLGTSNGYYSESVTVSMRNINET